MALKQIHADVAAPGKEPAHHARQELQDGRRIGRQADLRLPVDGIAVDGLLRQLNAAQDGLGALIQQCARGRGLDTAPVAVQQRPVQVALQFGHALAGRGSHQVFPFGCFGQALFLDGRNEDLQGRDI
ncbi:hypothetical protein D3C71_1696190 [compost metagenome]